MHALAYCFVKHLHSHISHYHVSCKARVFSFCQSANLIFIQHNCLANNKDHYQLLFQHLKWELFWLAICINYGFSDVRLCSYLVFTHPWSCKKWTKLHFHEAVQLSSVQSVKWGMGARCRIYIHQLYFHYTAPHALNMQMQLLFAPPMSFPMAASGLLLWCAVNFVELWAPILATESRKCSLLKERASKLKCNTNYSVPLKGSRNTGLRC